MKSLKQIREASGGKEAYQKFFNSLLKKFGVKSPSELEGDKKKEFYDAIDAGWEGDNEKPEANEAKKMVVTAIDKKTNSPAYKKFKAGDKRYIYKETYGDPDNLDPDTTMDADEEELKASYLKAHKDKEGNKMHASYGKMHAGNMMYAGYKKESVNEKTKLKAGKGKLGPKDAIDISFAGDKKDIKFASTKWKINIKPHSQGAFISGDKQKILAYLASNDYAMDDEDIEDLYPELMESKLTETQLKPGKGKVTVKLKNSQTGKELGYKYADRNKKAQNYNIKPHSQGAFISGDKQKILAYLASNDYAMDDEDIEDLYPELMESSYPKPLSIIRQQNEFSGDAETIRRKKRRFEDMAMCEQCGKMHEEGACMETDVTGDLDPETKGMEERAKGTASPKELKKQADMMAKMKKRQGRREEDDIEEAKKVKLSSSDMMKIAKIADKNSGDMEKSIKLIDKMKKGASEHPDVMAILKLANEDVNDHGSDAAVKAAKKKTPGQNEAVSVDTRTVGFKAAMMRSEKAKMKREKAKTKKAEKKNQAELDARYDYDGEVDDVMAAASRVMMGTKLETAANSVASGNVDMTPHKKKKDKEKIFARKY